MINLINLLNECFYVSQWLDIIRKYPQIIDLLKNDTEIVLILFTYYINSCELLFNNGAPTTNNDLTTITYSIEINATIFNLDFICGINNTG